MRASEDNVFRALVAVALIGANAVGVVSVMEHRKLRMEVEAIKVEQASTQRVLTNHKDYINGNREAVAALARSTDARLKDADSLNYYLKRIIEGK